MDSYIIFTDPWDGADTTGLSMQKLELRYRRKEFYAVPISSTVFIETLDMLKDGTWKHQIKVVI